MTQGERVLRRDRVGERARETAIGGRSALGEIVELAVLLDEPQRVTAARLLRRMLEERSDDAPGNDTVPPPARDGALERARARGRSRAAETLASPDMLTAEALARRLGVSRMTVNTWRKAGRLVGLSGAKRGYRFPVWQLDGHGEPFADLPRILELLEGSPWAVHRFMTSPRPELDGLTGRDALASGRRDAVLQAAESIARGTFV